MYAGFEGSVAIHHLSALGGDYQGWNRLCGGHPFHCQECQVLCCRETLPNNINDGVTEDSIKKKFRAYIIFMKKTATKYINGGKTFDNSLYAEHTEHLMANSRAKNLIILGAAPWTLLKHHFSRGNISKL